jgi:preprotein translocase SecE subunit
VEEMKKVSWPTWEELKSNTWMVIGLTIVLTLVIFFYDKIMNFALKMVLG